MGRIDLTGNEFSVELSDIHMSEFDGRRATACTVGFCVERTDVDPPETATLVLIRDLPVIDDLDELVGQARKELSLKLHTLMSSVDREEPMKVRAP